MYNILRKYKSKINDVGIDKSNFERKTKYRQLRAIRALAVFKDVLLRTRRALLP